MGGDRGLEQAERRRTEAARTEGKGDSKVKQGTSEKENDSRWQPEAIQDFLRARTSRQETREIVRDLLRGVGTGPVAKAAASGGVAAALSGFNDSPERFDPDPGRYADAFSRLLGAAAERASRSIPTLEWQAAEAESVARAGVGREV